MDNLHNGFAGMVGANADGVGATVRSTKKPVYQNEIYAVYPRYDMGYHIVNKITEVIESKMDTLPSAITQADVTRNVLKRILDEKEADETTPGC